MSGSTGAVSTERGGARFIRPGRGRVQVAEPSSSAGTVSDPWPHQNFIEMGALPTAVACGRAHALTVLLEWELDELVEDAILLVSELLTNALNASLTLPVPTPIALGLLADNERLIIEAWDRCVGGGQLDVVRHDDANAEQGRGLMIVEALSQRWGVRRPSYSFKIVWCELLIGHHGRPTRS